MGVLAAVLYFLDGDEAAMALIPALGSDVPRGEYFSHFCQILYFVFAVQQGQLRNLHNKLFLGCLFGECLYLTLFFTLINN
jgi:hypothetical protein